MPAGSKMDLPLAKAKPISASVITYLRRRKTLRESELLQPERGVRRCKKLCRHQGEGRAVDIVYLDFIKAFDIVSHKILKEKLMKYKLDEQLKRISNMKPSWRPSCVPQGLILGPVLINTFINELDDEAEFILSKFADDTKLRGVTDRPEGHDAIQRFLDKLENWVDRNLMKINKEKWKVLHLGRNNSRHQYMLRAVQLESSLAKKDLVVLMDKLNMCQPCTLAAKKVNELH
ncbi:mitochondrial enolase superfamily member 1 [Grus japonensis]|uniref:Mitochondrial enolase superfamily member 1 n=1 Tax=Grus japonensis TaxID=30415 RepID=A0ABC9W6V8_GRUJA